MECIGIILEEWSDMEFREYMLYDGTDKIVSLSWYDKLMLR